MKRISKVLCLFIGVVIFCFYGNEMVGACAEETYTSTYKDVTYEYRYTENGVEILGVRNDVKEMVLPEKIGGYWVTHIGNYAFYSCKRLKEIIIPKSVTSIGERAFNGCTSLTAIEILDGVTSIGDGAFSGCTSLIAIEIPDSVTSIGNSVFNGCTSLTAIEIPDSVTSIGNYAFRGCINLIAIEMPGSVTSIGGGAFSGCRSLTAIEIPDNVTSIGNYAFSGCTSLTAIEIPDSVTSIGESTFSDCNELYVYLPEDLTNIDNAAFARCKQVEKMHKYTEGYMSEVEACYAMTQGEDLLTCNLCGFEASHIFLTGKVIGGSKLVAPLIIEGTCDVCGVLGRWNDWSYVWITGIVAVVLLGFVIAIINYMRRMKKN